MNLKALEPPFSSIRFLKGDLVHIWMMNLDQSYSVASHRQELSCEERERADAYRFEKDQRHFTVARGTLRQILSCYLNSHPSLIQFSYSQYGKPVLAVRERRLDLRFSLSHSHGIALYALVVGRELGVDIEMIRSDFSPIEVAQTCFSSLELAALQMLPVDLHYSAFYTCWTRKEAYVKALGVGLNRPLQSFSVSLTHPPALLSIDSSENTNWCLFDIPVGGSFKAALAVEAPQPDVLIGNWRDASVP